jgi:ring-1,2-phenylacetyl-CoA epoxidase subunit PaaE
MVVDAEVLAAAGTAEREGTLAAIEGFPGDHRVTAATTKTQGARPSGFYPLVVRCIRPETYNAVVVTFDVPPKLQETFRVIEGQYLTLRLNIDGVEVCRPYSIFPGAQDPMLQIAIKRTPGGIFSNWIFDHLKPNDIVEVSPPEGRFHVSLSPSQHKNYIAFAVGGGITPVFANIKTILITESKSTFTLFYGNRTSRTVMFREQLADMQDRFPGRFSVIHVMSREHQDLDLLNGRITAHKCEQLMKRFGPFESIDAIFVCGPREMVTEVSAKLRTLGIADSKIKSEQVYGTENERPRQV